MKLGCDEAREDMYKLGSANLGSYHHAVTTGDGTWLTRGFLVRITHSHYVFT